MADPVNQHGGGYIPRSENRPYGNPRAHGGGYVPGQQNRGLSYSSTPQPPQQQYPQYQQQAQYQQPQQPVYQSRGISASRAPYPVSDIGEPKSEAYTSADEVDEYNDVHHQKKPVHLKGVAHFFHPQTRWRWKKPHLYQQPAFQYDSNRNYRHRDGMGRVRVFQMDDRYLSPYDGHLAKLHVQATDQLYDSQGTTTWRRTYIRSAAPMSIRIATWPIDFAVDPQSWKDWGIILLKFVPASFALTFCVLGGSTKDKYNGRYAPLAYKFHGYAKAARNQLENVRSSGTPHALESAKQATARLLRPKYLCFLKNPKDDRLQGAIPMPLKTWENRNRTEVLSYLFIAYSTEHFSHSSQDDLEALHHIAERATRDAKLPAYWVACSCMPDENEREEDVYRISDIMRGAEEMIIAVGASSNSPSSTSTEDLLRQWGRRMWTFPEVLLSQKDTTKVYTRTGKLDSPLVIPKNQFADKVWADATVSRQLIDHYAGNLGLSRLELVVLTLECLESRQTTQYLPGDHSYALMGLLRLRPKIDRTDTAFQAFARLSLMNDSDLLLERLICTMPKNQNQPWYDMSDAYGSSLWDIYPTCQVAGVGHDDSVIIDGTYGTSICWKGFQPIRATRRGSWRRWFAWKFMHFSSLFVLISFLLFGLGAPQRGGGLPQNGFENGDFEDDVFEDISYGDGGGANSSLIGAGVFFFLLGFSGWFTAPKLLQVILGGKFWDTEAAVFGFEGYLSVGTVERLIFGGNFGRLSWSSNGSPLSRHYKNKFGECCGIDPTDDVKVSNLVERAKTAVPGDQRIFTLVDTYSMTVTLFEAARPPTALIICGSEGGMQRAVGCSYDWTTGTLYRETVLRMPTTVLNRMDRVNKLKFGLKRPNMGVR